jgi:hypothetical protein
MDAHRPDSALTMAGSELDVDTIVAELKILRQGQARVDGTGKERLSSVLRATFGIRDTDNAAAVRAKVFSRLRAASEVLPDADRTAIAVAFGLTPSYRGRYYKDRVDAFASAQNVNPRTVRRWIDRGLPSFARALLSAREPNRVVTWWTDRLQLNLALDGPCAEALEVRSVVAARDGLTELDLAITVTDANPALVLEKVEFRVLYGGRLRVGPMESSDRVGLVLALPKPLQEGETHEYALQIRLPAEHPLRRHYVSVPRYPCANLDVRVRFPSDAPPLWVGKLVDVYQRDIDDDAVVAEQVHLDGAGEVHAEFTDLTPDRATGVRWRY